MDKTYRVEVREVVHTVLYVTARTGKEAATRVKNGVRPSGMYHRSIVSVRIER